MCYVHNQWYDISCPTLYYVTNKLFILKMISDICYSFGVSN